MTTFWPKRDKDGRYVGSTQTNQKHGIDAFFANALKDYIEQANSDYLKRHGLTTRYRKRTKCPICNDTGTTIPPYEDYDGAIVHYRIKCECAE